MPNHSVGSESADDDAGQLTPTGASERLDAALRAALPRYDAGYDAARRGLKEAVCAAVEELRAQGLGPEKVLVIIKAHVARHAPQPTLVLDDAVRWCIARYYATAGACKGPPQGEANDDG